MAADRSLLIRAGYVLATIVLGVGAYVLGSNVVDRRSDAGLDVTESPAAPVPSNFTEFVDEEGGFSLSYPEDWRILESNPGVELVESDAADPSHRRLVLGSSSTEPLLLVRVQTLSEEIVIPEDFTTEDLGVIQGQLDRLIESEDVRVAERRPTNHKGLLAWRYLYNFKDQPTGREGSHVHYFIFDGAKINILVFQAVPAEKMVELAPTFDKILESFESETRIKPRAVVSLPPASESD